MDAIVPSTCVEHYWHLLMVYHCIIVFGCWLFVNNSWILYLVLLRHTCRTLICQLISSCVHVRVFVLTWQRFWLLMIPCKCYGPGLVELAQKRIELRRSTLGRLTTQLQQTCGAWEWCCSSLWVATRFIVRTCTPVCIDNVKALLTVYMMFDAFGLDLLYHVQVGVEQMVTRAQCLDPYTRQCFAPLGIFFPFPLHCSKLESYLKRC